MMVKIPVSGVYAPPLKVGRGTSLICISLCERYFSILASFEALECMLEPPVAYALAIRSLQAWWKAARRVVTDIEL